MARSRPKKKTKTKRKPKQTSSFIAHEVAGLLMIGLALLILFEFGLAGRALANAGTFLLGWFGILIPIALIVSAVYLMVKRKKPVIRLKLAVGWAFIFTGLLLCVHLFWAQTMILAITSDNVLTETARATQISGTVWTEYTASGSGMAGALLYAPLHVLLDSGGMVILAIILMSIGVIILTGKTAAPYLAEKAPVLFNSLAGIAKKRFKRSPAKKKKKRTRPVAPKVAAEQGPADPVYPQHTYDVEPDEEEEQEEQAPIISAFTENVKRRKEEVPAEPAAEQAETELEVAAATEETGTDIEIISRDDETENEDYQLPPITLLDPPHSSDQSGEVAGIQQNARKLEKTFQSFGVRAKVTQIHLGPAVTKYEIMPDTGVKVSKIVNLHDDLALALAARDIRIEAPIPGKSAIGIEVPNSEVAVVSLREVLESEENNRPDKKLLVVLGRDVSGKAVLAELNKMPHLLVAGSTGSGKSVCINGIITSILMRAKPHEVKMMMIDPKMVELNVYNGIPHLLAPVVTDPRKAAQALKKVVSEMERRYELFSHTGTRNIEGYNEYVQVFNDENEEKHPKLPYIVVIVDELADLMMVASSEVEDAITRLAQMARAAGIHLIIATQRPSVNVITGVIKANIPARIAFSVSSAIDSRTILDMGGAEKLLGRGDMLFLGSGASKPVRVQGAFLSDTEVEKITDFAIEQQKAQYQEEMIPGEVSETAPAEETDEIYDEAVQLVSEMQTASVSMLQRRFRVGYSRAARIIDQMEQRGVVGPYEGSKPRTVLVPKPEDM
ncbi:FtsK/SpoIIIE family DNA translocase [Planococcus lenghuensis]|uniref:Cell division protein FtsK n=1 Tax=Planococcus lenghuensis TaxID=2213202 RepID=A0A1Q2KZU0_9BACL|nr:DNA translocase FtsK [Planococcus lenghuensis]AQQ53708.1 cell division protein FtsK [Planococcus lenghuensis]